MEKISGDIEVIRVAITGPESTGKSTLTEALADHYKTVWNSEYAREYLGNLKRDYNYDDIIFIAGEQYKREKDLTSKASGILFADTDFTVIKVWLEYRYKKCPLWITNEILNNPYDLYLLCDIDVPWLYDPLREHPDMREYFMDIYKAELKNAGTNYRIVSGDHENRLKNAIEIIDKLFF